MPFIDNAGFNKPNEWDHRCWIWIVTILSIVYSIFFLGARIFGKYGLLWFDDAVLSVAYVMAFVHWGLLMKAVAHGLGVALVRVGWSSREARVSRLYFDSRLLWLVCLYVAKLSLLVFNRKIFSGDLRREKFGFAATGATLIACLVVSVAVFSAGCDSALMLDGRPGSSCSGNTTRLTIVCVLDVVSELVLFLLPVALLAPVNMQRNQKRVVLLLYSFRFITTAFFIAQTTTFAKFDKTGPTSLAAAPALVLQELTLCSSFITCTIPCLRSFVGAFNSGGTFGTGSKKGNSYALTSMTPHSRGRSKYNRTDQSHSNMRRDLAQHGVSVVHDQRDDGSIASDGSEKMIIRRETRVAIQFDKRNDM